MINIEQWKVDWKKKYMCSEVELQNAVADNLLYTVQQSFESIEAKHMQNAW